MQSVLSADAAAAPLPPAAVHHRMMCSRDMRAMAVDGGNEQTMNGCMATAVRRERTPDAATEEQRALARLHRICRCAIVPDATSVYTAPLTVNSTAAVAADEAELGRNIVHASHCDCTENFVVWPNMPMFREQKQLIQYVL